MRVLRGSGNVRERSCATHQRLTEQSDPNSHGASFAGRAGPPAGLPDAGRTAGVYAATVARYKAAFLVRIWGDTDEPGESRPREWRGCVVHPVSQERRYFSEIVDLTAFLIAHAAHVPAGENDADG